MKKLKLIYKKRALLLFAIAFSATVFYSCEEYLNKAPESEITEDYVFGDIYYFQGFVENIYQGVVDLSSISPYSSANFNFGDDVICAGSTSLSSRFDNGDNWTKAGPYYTDGNQKYINGNRVTRNTRSYWDGGWFNIRNSNMGLEKLPLLINATDDEKNLIKGQLLFFRGYYHWEILKSFGGIPYITGTFEPSQKLKLPRLSYKETAEKIDADLKQAAELLPVNWDNTEMGKKTLGQNEGRLTKGAAYGYIGKNWLYAASPLMNGSSSTTGYNQEFCLKAAEAFAEIFKLVSQGVYQLVPWNQYSENFYRMDGKGPYTRELIFNNPIYGKLVSAGRVDGKMYNRGEFTIRELGGGSNIASPTENYVQNFGMNNGLPINDPASGFNPNDPWKNRDPRFYYNIVLDGERIVQKTDANDKAQFFVGGRHRASNNVISGYMHKKFRHLTCNSKDNGWGGYQRNVWFWEIPNMRLADVYLMYAEAVNEAIGPQGSVNGGPTALEAVNIVRRRVIRPDGTPLPDLSASYSTTKEQLREAIRNERAVELAFESHRYDDLRRWRLAHELKYRQKYILEFDKNHTYYTPRLYYTRTFDEKHYWLPFQLDMVELYEGFTQNPGW